MTENINITFRLDIRNQVKETMIDLLKPYTAFLQKLYDDGRITAEEVKAVEQSVLDRCHAQSLLLEGQKVQRLKDAEDLT